MSKREAVENTKGQLHDQENVVKDIEEEGKIQIDPVMKEMSTILTYFVSEGEVL